MDVDVPKKKKNWLHQLGSLEIKKWQKLPDVAHGDDVMVWHTSAQ